jgi:hypothetical protein
MKQKERKMRTAPWIRRLVPALLPALLLVAACQSTEGPPPRDTAGEVAGLLVAGKTAEADARFATLAGENDRALAYEVLFDRARKLTGQRDYDSSMRINRFLVKHYPDRLSAREALLYALWLDRARSGEPHPDRTRREMEDLAVSIGKAGTPPVWADLAMAQVAADDGNVTVARASMARFRSRWNGRPASLGSYVTEMERWIASNGGR